MALTKVPGSMTNLTKADVGLDQVDNTADADKPVPSSVQTALDAKAPINNPTFTGTVAGITKSMVGLENVDNTSDAAKPVSTAQQAALDLKAPLASPTFTGTVSGVTKAMVGLGNVDNTSDAAKPISTATQEALDLKASLASTRINQATNVDRPLKVRTPAEWADSLGVMCDTNVTGSGGFSDAIIEAVATGRRVYVPAGTYTFNSAISVASLTKPLKLELDRQANLVAHSSLRDGLLKVIDGADNYVEIEGGTWDGSDQPEADLVGLGESWGLIMLTNIRGGGIVGARFTAGADYRDLKSDSAIFCVAEEFSISKNAFVGFSDSAIYDSGNNSGLSAYGVNIDDNKFYGCRVGVISKRRANALTVTNNAFRSCYTGLAAAQASVGGSNLAGARRIIGIGNQFDECVIPVYLESADNSIISNNRIRGWGYDLDGASPAITRAAIRLLGVSGAKISDNSITPVSVNTDLHGVLLEGVSVNGVVTQCTYNTVSDNYFDGGAGCGRAIYEANTSDYNFYDDNNVVGTWSLEQVLVGTNSISQRKNTSGQRVLSFASSDRIVVKDDIEFNLPTSGRIKIPRPSVSGQRIELFEDGTGAHFRGQSLSTAAKKLYFESNADAAVTGGALGHEFLVAGSKLFDITATGLGFNGASTIAKPTVTGSRGSNAALQSLLTALANYGLITDSSS